MNQATATARANKILIVDDDARIRDLLRRYLAQEGFEVILAEDSKALNRILVRDTVDLIVLDLMLPGEDGLSICRRLRAANDLTPIIMLTAKVEDVDRIVGLEVGADDYLPKPFNPRELLARIHAVLRRRPTLEAPGAPALDAQTVSFGPFEFDLALRRLSKEGEQIALTTGEFSMLKAPRPERTHSPRPTPSGCSGAGPGRARSSCAGARSARPGCGRRARTRGRARAARACRG